MTTTGPGLSTGKSQRSVGRAGRVGRVGRTGRASQVDDEPTQYPDWEALASVARKARLDDPTHYPDWEPMARDPIESLIVRHFEPVVIRYLAERGVVCYVGSDNFIYWEEGNNNASVAPDIYILPGVLPTAHPRKLEGSNDEGCWKTWLMGGVVPNFALEVKAFKNPRKDELQAPANHDALGTKELIVFDPYWRRRRAPRKRFCVRRRNAAGKLVIVAETNDDRVYSEVLEAFLVAQGNDETGLLRLGLGPNGDMILPLESERSEMEARRADEEARMRQEQTRRADEQTRRADEEARMRQEQARRADEEARMRQEQTRRADEEARMRQEQAQRADEEARMRQEQAQRADEEARMRQEQAQRADDEARMRQEQTRRADEEARMRQEQARRADEEARMRQEQAQRADEEARMRQEQTRRADEEARMRQEQAQRVSELESELARLRASINKPAKRSTKK